MKASSITPFNFLICSGGTTTRCAADRYWTLDLRKNYKFRSLDKEKKEILIGAGNTMGELLQEIYEMNRVFPTGISTETGIGYILTGGVSPLSRSQGLAIDQIKEIEGYWGTGEEFKVNKPNKSSTKEEIRTWKGLCGAAPFLAIVTQLRLGTYPIKPLFAWELEVNSKDLINMVKEAENFSFSHSLQWVWTDSIKTLRIKVAELSQKTLGYKEETSNIYLEDTSNFYQCSSLYQLLQPKTPHRKEQLENSVHTEVVSLVGGSWGDKSKEIIELISYLMNNRPHSRCSIAVQQMGGAIKNKSNESSSFIHRNAMWKPWITAAWEAGDHHGRERSLNWLETVWRELEPICPGVHLAQIHPHLKWHKREVHLAFNDWLPGLKELKNIYDPNNVFPPL